MSKAPSKPIEKEEVETEKLVPIYVSSKGIETRPESFVDEQGKKKARHFIHGDVNGVKFKVECNKQMMVPESVFGALEALLAKQASDAS